MGISFSDEQVRITTWGTNPPIIKPYDFNAMGIQLTISFTVHPCCKCDAALGGINSPFYSLPVRNLGSPEFPPGSVPPLETTSLLQPPCSLNPVAFIVIGTAETSWKDPSGNLLMGGLLNTPGNLSDVLEEAVGDIAGLFSVACQNVFQAVYHLVRLDLGVILENQIYNSPEIFNRTIQSYNASNAWRLPALNTTMMATWQKEVDFFKSSDRVPVLQYLRSTPRVKPLGSAITSVFVSTFAMLSALWTIFSIVAGALANVYNDTARQDEHTPSPTEPLCKLEDGTGREGRRQSGGHITDSNLAFSQDGSSCLEKMAMKNMPTDVAFAHLAAHVERSLARINFVLKQHGLMQDSENPEDEIGTVISRVGSREEHIPLLHRIGTRTTSDADSVP